MFRSSLSPFGSSPAIVSSRCREDGTELARSAALQQKASTTITSSNQLGYSRPDQRAQLRCPRPSTALCTADLHSLNTPHSPTLQLHCVLVMPWSFLAGRRDAACSSHSPHLASTESVAPQPRQPQRQAPTRPKDMTVQAPQRKLRILALHGYLQSGGSARRRRGRGPGRARALGN